MSVTVNIVRASFYLDSVALMRLTRDIKQIDGVMEAAMMMATPANKAIMQNAGVLTADGEAAASGDLVIAIEAQSEDVATLASAEAARGLDAPKKAIGGSAQEAAPMTLRAAFGEQPASNLVLISVPGNFAVAEAKKAVRRGLNVMIFSDNIPVEAEAALKAEAQARGVLVMGPDCGTAIIQGIPLAFANIVPRGSIGIIGASGTGIQEVSSLIAKRGGGISHAIGTGGRDLKESVGGITALMAFDLMDADPGTKIITVISKPPAKSVAARLIDRIRQTKKPTILCFLGAEAFDLPPHAQQAFDLDQAARLAIEHVTGTEVAEAPANPSSPVDGRAYGLFAGGTLCSEAQLVFQAAGLPVGSNVPVPGAAGSDHDGHRMIDLGDDQFTQGRPHPMIDPAVRDQPLLEALNDPAAGLILIDCVLGTGSHLDPAGAIVDCLKQGPVERPLIIASITGTAQDPQSEPSQRTKLEQAGVIVASSNAEAARLAVRCLRR